MQAMSSLAIFALTTLLPSLVVGLSATNSSASPKNALQERTVYSPPILEPTHGTVWKPHSHVTVRWNANGIPKNASPKGKLVLGWQDHPGGSEHLNLSHPLASGIDLRKGMTTVIAPEVAPGNNYIVALFGDSGNISPSFTIL
ncbi:hypothetical protein ONZ45_g16712 [Pleurotus djamor]|nr:hypothetical protein ONZ45_g16712 [Pleurotus djamor]